MTQIAEKLRDELLRLPTEDRAELAYCLIRSLDDDDDVTIQAAWETELECRWQKMENGETIGKPAEDVFARLQKKYL
jgi:putative addiction module component (TIGR02574 family)